MNIRGVIVKNSARARFLAVVVLLLTTAQLGTAQQPRGARTTPGQSLSAAGILERLKHRIGTSDFAACEKEFAAWQELKKTRPQEAAQYEDCFQLARKAYESAKTYNDLLKQAEKTQGGPARREAIAKATTEGKQAKALLTQLVECINKHAGAPRPPLQGSVVKEGEADPLLQLIDGFVEAWAERTRADFLASPLAAALDKVKKFKTAAMLIEAALKYQALEQLAQDLNIQPQKGESPKVFGRRLANVIYDAKALNDVFKPGRAPESPHETRGSPTAGETEPPTRPTPAAPNLPPFVKGGKTSGVLRTPTAELPLQSGWEGPASAIPKGTSGFDIVTRTHVEGHASAVMRQQGLKEATVYINNPEICPSCTKLLPRMLPPGSKLTVVLPNGTSVTFTGLGP